jgi:hypothetical protein
MVRRTERARDALHRDHRFVEDGAPEDVPDPNQRSDPDRSPGLREVAVQACSVATLEETVGVLEELWSTSWIRNNAQTESR